MQIELNTTVAIVFLISFLTIFQNLTNGVGQLFFPTDNGEKCWLSSYIPTPQSVYGAIGRNRKIAIYFHGPRPRKQLKKNLNSAWCVCTIRKDILTYNLDVSSFLQVIYTAHPIYKME